MFRGLNAINLDTKGRLTIPTKYRERLMDLCAGKLILTIDTEHRCLLLYPSTTWHAIEAKIAGLPSFNAAARRIQRLLIGHATEVEFDANARFLLPAVLRDYANLNKKIMLLGQGNKFEIWSEQTWHECREEWLTQPALNDEALPPEMQTLSL